VFWKFTRPILFALPAEAAHEVSFGMLELFQGIPGVRGFLSRRRVVSDPRLNCRVFGLDFPNPVGLAAGFDKNARLLPVWRALGFGFAEVGTVTAMAQEGNPRPRLFRISSDEALINRLGFNNDGAAAIRERLLALRHSKNWPAFPVGINLGKSGAIPIEKAAEDYAQSLEQLWEAGDYFVVNVSSPNTPGLRDLQEKSRLDDLLGYLQEKNRAQRAPAGKPLLAKISPDLNWKQLDDVLEACVKHGVAGLVATNTTLSREGLSGKGKEEGGGLSGRPLRGRSTEFIRYIHRETSGRLPIIGVGGVFGAEDAWEKIRAGASLIQAYTGFVYGGPAFARRINEGMIRLMEREGVSRISEVAGRG